MNEHNPFALENTLSLLLEGKKYASLRDVLSTMNPSDIAAVFEKLPEDSLPLLFRLLPIHGARVKAEGVLFTGYGLMPVKETPDDLSVFLHQQELPAEAQFVLFLPQPASQAQICTFLRRLPASGSAKFPPFPVHEASSAQDPLVPIGIPQSAAELQTAAGCAFQG